MAQHKWVLSKGSTDRTRVFRCERCDAGPVHKDIFNGKGSIAKMAKEQGFSNDCNLEVAKKVMES